MISSLYTLRLHSRVSEGVWGFSLVYPKFRYFFRLGRSVVLSGPTQFLCCFGSHISPMRNHLYWRFSSRYPTFFLATVLCALWKTRNGATCDRRHHIPWTVHYLRAWCFCCLMCRENPHEGYSYFCPWESFGSARVLMFILRSYVLAPAANEENNTEISYSQDWSSPLGTHVNHHAMIVIFIKISLIVFGWLLICLTYDYFIIFSLPLILSDP